jgi:hypothetical protein
MVITYTYWIKGMAKDVVIGLTRAQAQALLTLAEEGGQGILTAQDCVNGLLKGSTVAANNALKKLREAVRNEG